MPSHWQSIGGEKASAGWGHPRERMAEFAYAYAEERGDPEAVFRL